MLFVRPRLSPLRYRVRFPRSHAWSIRIPTVMRRTPSSRITLLTRERVASTVTAHHVAFSPREAPPLSSHNTPHLLHTHTHTHTHFTHTLFLHLLTHTHTLTHTYNLVLLSVYMRERVDGTRLTPLHTCPRWPLGQICSASRSSARRSARLEATSGLGIHTSVCVSV